MIEYGEYRIADPEGLETPAMLVFEVQLSHNLEQVCQLAGGGQNLMMHVKTHKSAVVASRQLEAGIAGFKCATLRELEMVLEAGAREVILAYPLVQRSKAERFAELAAAHPQAQIRATIGAREHLELLAAVADQRQCDLPVMLDLDVGMHRTGIPIAEEAETLYRAMAGHPRLKPAGLHAYDGHARLSDPQAREEGARLRIQEIEAFKTRLGAAGLSVPLVVGGGSFSFPYYARTEGMRGSPGTCVYWDLGYGNIMLDMPFRWAALVLTQVVDCHPGQNTVTTDLGTKAVAGDPPLANRARLLGKMEAELVLQNEEHGVFHWPGDLPRIGTYLLAVPGHICPTTVLYPGSYVLDAEGEVSDYYPHAARDRQ
jgi:D-serine deaminase-like pyridoxal phosphate-dependent protein